MRIIAGEWKRRNLRAPKGDATRPTADRTRETLFSMLASRLGNFDGLAVMDLFAGSGAMGLEALSRGAATCTFVEQEAEAIRSIRANIAALQAQSRCDVQARSVMGLGAARSQPDLILLDPPYGTNAGVVALDKMNRLGWIKESCWMALETDGKEAISIKGMKIEAERKVGKAKLTLLTLES